MKNKGYFRVEISDLIVKEKGIYIPASKLEVGVLNPESIKDVYYCLQMAQFMCVINLERLNYDTEKCVHEEILYDYDENPCKAGEIHYESVKLLQEEGNIKVSEFLMSRTDTPQWCAEIYLWTKEEKEKHLTDVFPYLKVGESIIPSRHGIGTRFHSYKEILTDQCVSVDHRNGHKVTLKMSTPWSDDKLVIDPIILKEKYGMEVEFY